MWETEPDDSRVFSLQATAPTTSSSLSGSSPSRGKWPCWTAPWWCPRSSTTRRNRTTSPGTTPGRAGKWPRRQAGSWSAERLCGSSMWRWRTLGNTSPWSGEKRALHAGSHHCYILTCFFVFFFCYQNFYLVLQADHRAGGGAAGPGWVQEAQDGSPDAHQRGQCLPDLSSEGLHGQAGELQRFLLAQVVQGEWKADEFESWFSSLIQSPALFSRLRGATSSRTEPTSTSTCATPSWGCPAWPATKAGSTPAPWPSRSTGSRGPCRRPSTPGCRVRTPERDEKRNSWELQQNGSVVSSACGCLFPNLLCFSPPMQRSTAWSRKYANPPVKQWRWPLVSVWNIYFLWLHKLCFTQKKNLDPNF